MDLFQQQASNRRRTWMVMAVFVAFLFFLGYGFDLLYLRSRMPVTAWLALIGGAIGAYAVATGVGLGRVYDRQAWPSDVFIGAALGTAIGRSIAYLSHTPDEKRAAIVPYVTAGRDVATGLMVQIRF